MPLLRFDLYKAGWEDKSRVKQLLDLSYEVMRETFGAPEGDRYQIVSYHEPEDFITADTGLGFTRTNQFISLSVRTRPRTTEQKENFYRELVARIHSDLGIDPQDVMINLVSNTDEDWSFGLGKAQFLTGDL
ncbi:tautomerase family protein [Weissella cibaria]|uniref:tautomerase family protein n=1 Tax=Weissella cibaria TaxID=137591 RepID=UPI0011973214|nr:tautomerase family protein [Weissella cibaria]TVV19706.1 tautomerase family protein [Weissella cibaria]